VLSPLFAEECTCTHLR